MNIGFVTFEQMDNRPFNSIGSTRIRCRWVYESWKDKYPDDEAGLFSIGRKYDVMVFQKVYWEQMLDSYDGIKIIDLCDPDWLEGRDVMRFVNKCDYCTTSTENLANYIRKFVKTPTVCVPDRVYPKEYIPREKHEGKARKVVWFGYSQNQHYITPALDILREYNMELHVICEQPYVPPMGMGFHNVVNHTFSYPAVNELIKQCDMYIAPERQDERGKYKSNNKEIQSMALGVPVCRSADDLERLLDPDERNKQVEKDLQEIKEKWLVEKSVVEMKGIIDECYARKKESMV